VAAVAVEVAVLEEVLAEAQAVVLEEAVLLGPEEELVAAEVEQAASQD
jgi:hypothetical protein